MENRLKTYVSLLVVPLLLLFVVGGCVNFKAAGEYDEQTEVAVTQIRHKMEQFLTGLEPNIGTDAGSYANNKKFYDEIQADIGSARTRVAAIQGSEYANQQLGFMRLYVINLEKTHEYGIIAEDIPPIRTSFDNSCASIIRREQAKKR